MAEEVRGMRIRMERHSSKAASSEAFGSAPGIYDMDSPQPM